MRNVNNSVETVNAAATAIISAESRVQPTAGQKRIWRRWWNLYWCFGSQKKSKRIGHAVLVHEPVVAPGAPETTIQTSATSTSIVLPFVAPPSSPASFLQSDPPSVTQSPAGLLSLSVNTHTQSGSSSGFAIGPYAHETQLVTPPAFSAFTTEPSTAPFTPPPESIYLTTTPSSPEVPFAQLLTSSLEHAGRNNGGMNQKFSSSHYEFQSYQVYPASPGGNLISPGSVISNSGTSSPFPGKCPIIEFRIGEPLKPSGFEQLSARKQGSRVGSGCMTPAGRGSRLGTSGEVMSEIASEANCSKHEEVAIDHRVSFELTGDNVRRCLASKLDRSSFEGNQTVTEGRWGERRNSGHGETGGGKEENQKVGCSSEFKFDGVKEETAAENVAVRKEWWANEKVAGKGHDWSFFHGIRSSVS